MPNRIIREAILSSEKMALLGWPEEVFYRRLMSIVDDYGRTEGNPQLLRSRCYPLQTDTVRVADISRWMAACQKAGLILDYAVEGKQYVELIKFGQQQRSASKYPTPSASASNCEQAPADAHLVVFGVEDVSVVDKAPTVLVAGTAYRPPSAPCAEIVESYRTQLPQLPGVEVLNDARKRAIGARWREVCVAEKFDRTKGLEWFDWFFGHVGKSRFLTGRVPGKDWRADLDFLMTPTKFAKVIEGSYHKETA